MLNNNYDQALSFMHGIGYEEISGLDFYEELFPDNEKVGEQHTDYSHPNAIYLYHDNEKGKLRRRIMLQDTWEDDFQTYIEGNTMTLCSGLVYRKRANKLQNAQRMNALVFDLDGVGENELRNIELRWNVPADHLRSIPRPTYTVLSGSGVHFYYFFNEPIDLYPNIKIQLKSLKYDLTFRMWEYKSTSQLKQVQYQSINQSFRMVGSVNSKYDRQVRAFRTGDRVDISFLNQYVPERSRVDLSKPFKPTQHTLTEAMEKYPDWYERVVIKGIKKAKKWAISEKVNGSDPYALYHWWMKQADKIQGGHRYYFLMCMAIYACKCDVPKKKLVEDMNDIFSYMAGIEHTNPLTKADVKSALEAYDQEYYDTSIKEIEYWTDVRIERNKRNGRTQAQHLARARAVQNIDYPDGEWREGNGRKSKQEVVREWQLKNPEGKKAACARETGLHINTVYKWWTSSSK